MTRSLPIAVAVALTAMTFAASLPGPATAMGGPDSCKPEYLLENEDVRIWFHGKKGMTKVWTKNNSSGEIDGMYMYKTTDIVELDENNNTVARMNLERAYPQTSSCEVIETEEFLNVTFVVTDDVKPASGGPSAGQATVTWAYHFNKTASGAKYDLFVADWPWQSNSSELQYDFTVHSADLTIEDAENGLGFRDQDGDTRGYIEWAPNATAEYDDDTNQTAIVDSYVSNDGSNAAVGLRFTNVTAGYSFLDYDPWAGAGDYIIVLNRLIGLGFVRAALPQEARALYDATISQVV